jgi:hypothetical protein
MATTASIDPGKIVASPIMLKYAAMIEMLNAETKVDIAKIMVFYSLNLAAVFYLRGLLLRCPAGSSWGNALRCHLSNNFGRLLLSLSQLGLERGNLSKRGFVFDYRCCI